MISLQKILVLSSLLLLSSAQQEDSLDMLDGPLKIRNETLRIQLTQGFFDNLQNNIVAPLFKNLPSLLNLTLNPMAFAGDLGAFNVSGNFTSLDANQLSVGNESRLVQLHDGYTSFDMAQFVLDFAIGYELITDPPIMADIGTLNISVDNMGLEFNTTTSVLNNELILNFTYLNLSLDHFGLEFDGLNDFLYVMNGLIGKIVSLVVGQVGYVIENDLASLGPLINKIIGMIPEKIPIPGTLLHLDLGFASTPISREGLDLQLPMSIILQSDMYPYNEVSKANFTNMTANETYEIQMALSQNMIDNILYEVHKNGPIVIDTGDLLNTTLTVGVISAAAGGTWTGFNSSAPCKLILTTLDPYPKLFMHPVLSHLEANISTQVWCKRNDTPEDPYEYSVNFDTELTLDSDIKVIEVNETVNDTVRQEYKIIIKVDSLTWKFNSVIDSVRGNFVLWLLNLTLGPALAIVAGVINGLLAGGLGINWLISEIIGTDFFYFSSFDLEQQEELLVIKLTPALRFEKEIKLPSPATFQAQGFGDMMTELAQKQTELGGIEQYVADKIERMLVDL